MPPPWAKGSLPAWASPTPAPFARNSSTAPAAPEKDAACLLALARWSGRYSPSLNVDGDDGLWLDVSGVPHLFGGARALLDDMARRFAKLGFSARIALAETLGGAHALARYAHSSSIIVPQGKIG